MALFYVASLPRSSYTLAIYALFSQFLCYAQRSKREFTIFHIHLFFLFQFYVVVCAHYIVHPHLKSQKKKTYSKYNNTNKETFQTKKKKKKNYFKSHDVQSNKIQNEVSDGKKLENINSIQSKSQHSFCF